MAAVGRAEDGVWLLRSDGRVVAFGGAVTAPLPPLPAGTHYTAVAAGGQGAQAFLLRSDGCVVAAGVGLRDSDSCT